MGQFQRFFFLFTDFHKYKRIIIHLSDVYLSLAFEESRDISYGFASRADLSEDFFKA